MWWHSKFLLHHSLREKDLLPELPPNAFICVSCFSSSSTIIQGHLGTREKPSSKALEINILSIMSVLYSEKNLIYELPPPKDIYHSLMKYSVQFSHSVMSNSLRQHGQQHTRLPCPSPVPEIVHTHVHQAGDAIQHLILCHPLLCLSSIFPSIRGFSNESVLLIRWPKYWSFSFSISPSNGYPGLISFRIYWFDLLTVQGTLKSLLWHHSSKVSILRCSTLFMV